MATDAQIRLAGALRRQVEECERLGSHLYGFLLSRAADDVKAGGPCWEALGEESAQHLRTLPALQLMGAMHRLVLRGTAPSLAPFYPSVNGTVPHTVDGWERLWLAFIHTLEREPEQVRILARRPVQTNEVARSAALAGGFLTVARETELPLRILELGASAGLNLRWDRYRYEAAGLAWGDPASPVRFACEYTQGVPPLATPARVVQRIGCDRAPLDATNPEDRLTLLSYVWADQLPRMQRLRAALALAAACPVRIDTADAPEWAARELAHAHSRLATVVYHSIVLGYLQPEDRARLVATLEDAGRRVTATAPLAWLRLESDARGATEASLRLTCWPGGEERLLARAGFHGQNVRWLNA